MQLIYTSVSKSLHLKALMTATLLLFFLVQHQSYAQEILLREQPAAELDDIPSWGPNRRHNIQLSMGYGLYPLLNPLMSHEFSMLSRASNLTLHYKLKLTPFLSVVAETGYIGERFRTTSGSVSIIDRLIYDKELLSLQSAMSAVKIRLNPDIKRGNTIGKYLEFGIYTSYAIFSRQITVQKTVPSPQHYREQKTVNRGLSVVNPHQYGLTMSVGYNKVGLFYKHRLSKWLTGLFNSGDLPDHQIGLRWTILN